MRKWVELFEEPIYKVQKSFPKENKRMYRDGMLKNQPNKMGTTPQHIHTILHLVPFCQLCFVFVSCVHRRVEEGSGEGIAVCCAC